jgi:hypothetical protein
MLRSCLEAFERYTHGFLERVCLDYLSDFDVLLIIEEKTAVNVHSYPPLGGNAQSYPALLGFLPGCRPTLARVLTLPLVWLNVQKKAPPKARLFREVRVTSPRPAAWLRNSGRFGAIVTPA